MDIPKAVTILGQKLSIVIVIATLRLGKRVFAFHFIVCISAIYFVLTEKIFNFRDDSKLGTLTHRCVLQSLNAKRCEIFVTLNSVPFRETMMKRITALFGVLII
jgi:hypothetical protein